jgi:chorismate dehydratase
MRRLRISAISFLNTAPLMWDFEHGERAREFDIAYTVPSLCAEALRAGAADIGIIPAITYATIPNLAILSDIAIAARGPVRSILLVSKKPLEQVKTIATDSSSRTSVALLRVLLEKQYGGGRELTTMSPSLTEMLAAHDAALLIGDSALRVDRSKYVVYDLAEEWRRLTGKAFVFAVWALRLEALRETPRETDLPRIFRDSRQHGLEPQNVAELAREWAPRVGISEAAVKSYLTTNIHYYLDAEALDGLELFFRYAAECGVIPCVPELRFLGAPVCTLVR